MAARATKCQGLQDGTINPMSRDRPNGQATADPRRVGSDQVRGVRFEGELLVLLPPPHQSAGLHLRRPLRLSHDRGPPKTTRFDSSPLSLRRPHLGHEDQAPLPKLSACSEIR